MKRICVFCGSNQGARPQYRQAAMEFAEELAARRIGLVYGGASVGLMGIIANKMLSCGGEVVGVIPNMLADREVAHRNLTELHEVNSMHERKALMAELSDGFATLPGGFGTLEEFTEVVSWRLLGIHQKPCGLLNVGGYFDALLKFLDYAVAQHFIKPAHRADILVEANPTRLVEQLQRSFTGPNGSWLSQKEKT
ncbi:MAG: TIGR00730 family Rossman fold protein [Deltaproteobacteria bacterium]|nr:TIGR00730 family Rossman fold protein [Deltaproteobacteria bacterium]